MWGAVVKALKTPLLLPPHTPPGPSVGGGGEGRAAGGGDGAEPGRAAARDRENASTAISAAIRTTETRPKRTLRRFGSGSADGAIACRNRSRSTGSGMIVAATGTHGCGG